MQSSSGTQRTSLKTRAETRQCLARLLIYKGTELLWEKFDSIYEPEDLAWILNDPDIRTKLLKLLNLQDSLKLAKHISSGDVYLWLISNLLRTICGLTPPDTGWYNMPHGESFEEVLARIECYCTSFCDKEMTDARFNYLWREISEAFLRIAASISPEKRSQWKIFIDELFQDPIKVPEVDNYVNEHCFWIRRRTSDMVIIIYKNWDEWIGTPAPWFPWYIVTSVAAAAVAGAVVGVTVGGPAAFLASSVASFVPALNVFAAITGDTKAPHEIRARGPLALKIYNKALKEGKTIVRRLPIMMVGQERVGKTSLKKSLKGERFDANEESTRGIEVDPSHFEVTTEIWRQGKSSQTAGSDSALSFDHHAAQMISCNLKNVATMLKCSKCKAKNGESTQKTNDAQPKMMQSFSSQCTETASRVTRLEQEHENPQIPEDLANLTQKFIAKDIELGEEDEIYSILWDFGGQSVYYVTHPLFLTPRAIYLLTYDLSRNPNDKAIPVQKRGLFKELEDSFTTKSNLDYLDSWMSSVASLVSHDDDDYVQIGHLSEKLPKKLPPVFLVCTNADRPYGGQDPATVAAEIFGSLQGKSYSMHLFDGVFAVDNTKSGSGVECPEVVRLRNEILAVAKELPHVNEEIPLKWLKFEKEVQAKVKEGYKWISLEEARQVAIEVCQISDEEEFMTLVRLLHDQRIIVHFDDNPSLNKMVVLDIQWLVDVFKKVITIEPYDGKAKQYKDLWLKLEKTGILDEKLLQHVWGPIYDQKETSESLIEIMERFSLLCSWPSSEERKQYLVPSMLMTHPEEDIIRLVKSSQVPSLYLTFNSSQVPIGLFPRMVLQFYQWCSKEWPTSSEPKFYQNFARFYIDPDSGCSVILLCHSSFIEIVVHRPNDDVLNLSERLQTMAELSSTLSDRTPHVIVARAVHRQVGLMLKCMPKEFVWLKNMECEMKVLCSVCCPGGSVHYCQDHAVKDCKQEQCLHFWSEAELQSGQQFCGRSAIAGDPRLNLQQIAPWFAFLEEQQVIDGCAAKELLSTEEKEAKALVLSTGVLESLRSISEASSVVAQLQESLELNQDAFADPEPETKRVIRSLAVIAKSENRLDVVKHLREITPAGTTGPLLPECFDVKKIPLPQLKVLTFSLCGGDEWMLLADKLGLTPAEIRYLDNRTLNPCLEALSHIRHQRFINVDTLYNALVECGLEMLADLL
ncbi:uncharacterized protein LOC144663539 isoform X2 [Oculina patagonica]